MINKLKYLIILLFLPIISFSQQLPHYSLYMMNDVIVNPSILSAKTDNQLTLMFRDQWTGFEGAPKTQSISYNNVNHSKFGRGINIVNDITGPISALSATVSGSYIVPVKNKNVLTVGASVNILQYKIDNNQIILEDDGITDPALQGGIDKTLAHSGNIGAFYYSDKYFIGASVLNILSSKLNVSNSGVANRLINHYYLNAGYSFDYRQDIEIIPSVMFKKVGASNLQMDLNVKTVFNETIWGGISYRTNDAIIAMIGMNFNEYSLGYSYDITTTKIKIPSYGSHGIVLSYKFKAIEKDTDKDGILDKDDECPKMPGPIELNGCPDRDKDGIIDKEDECPDFPGLLKNNGCPDRDSDGVIDKYDRCPDIPGIQELNGCPDSDGDGLQDALDRCPYEFGLIENFGCPKDSVIIIEHKPLVATFQNLEFEFNKSNLTFLSKNMLEDAGRYLAENSDIKIKIIGHTDNIGSDRYNMILSKKRVKSVKKYLVEGGINANRIEIDWKGKSEPVNSGDSEKARSENRRVEFKILK